MECKKIEEFLSPYLDKELAGKEKALVEEHLRICPRCSEGLERLQKTVRLVSSLKEVEPPKDFLGEIHRKLRAESRLKRFLNRLFFPLQVKLPLEALAAVLIAVVIFSLSRYYPLGQVSRSMAKRLPAGLEREEKREIVAGDATSPVDKEGEMFAGARRVLPKRETDLFVREEVGKAVPERGKDLPLLEASELNARKEAEPSKARVPQLEAKGSFSFAERGKAGADRRETGITTSLAPSSVSAVKEKREEALVEERAETVTGYFARRALSDNYQVQVATENIPLGLIKAQKVIYLNKGKIISPSDKDIVNQVASREIKHSQILFEMPSRNYSRVLTQLKEVGKITFIIPPKNVKQDKVKFRKAGEKPALIQVQLELTQTEER